MREELDKWLHSIDPLRYCSSDADRARTAHIGGGGGGGGNGGFSISAATKAKSVFMLALKDACAAREYDHGKPPKL